MDLRPPVGFHFRVRFAITGDAIAEMRFAEVGGLTAEVTTEELVEGGENRFSHRLPGRTKYGTIVLKRGFLKNSKLIAWARKAIDDLDIEPTTVLVELLDATHTVLSAWKVINAYPVKWSVSEFKASENAYVTETLELAFQYFKPA